MGLVFFSWWLLIHHDWLWLMMTGFDYCLVLGPPLWKKYEGQLGWWFPLYGKVKTVPNHQPLMGCWSKNPQMMNGEYRPNMMFHRNSRIFTSQSFQRSRPFQRKLAFITISPFQRILITSAECIKWLKFAFSTFKKCHVCCEMVIGRLRRGALFMWKQIGLPPVIIHFKIVHNKLTILGESLSPTDQKSSPPQGNMSGCRIPQAWLRNPNHPFF